MDRATMPELTGDPEGDHSREDGALWEFVYQVAQGECSYVGLILDARRMVKWDKENEDRARWYA